jgi:hypothetical protein
MLINNYEKLKNVKTTIHTSKDRIHEGSLDEAKR